VSPYSATDKIKVPVLWISYVGKPFRREIQCMACPSMMRVGLDAELT